MEIQYDNGRIERKWAVDTGGAIKGNKIDVFVWSEQQARNNGKQRVKVHVVGHKPI